MFTTILERSPTVSWRRVFEHPRWLKGLRRRVPLIVSGRLSPEPCIAAFLFASKTVNMARKSGLLFVALYLKQCASSLRQYVGGVKQDNPKIFLSISLS